MIKRLFKRKPKSAPAIKVKGASLSLYLTTLMCTIVLTAMIAIAWFAYDQLRDSKLVDAFTLLYLQLENQTDTLQQRLVQYKSESDFKDLQGTNEKNYIRYTWKFGRFVREVGEGPRELKVEELGVDKPKNLSRIHVVRISGVEYLASFDRSSRALHLVRVPLESWIANSFMTNEEALVYAITADGKKIFANNQQMNESNIVKRVLVQKFIDLPTSQGQFEFTARTGREYYGFFSQITGSNIILFAEMSKTIIFDKIWEFTKKFLLGAAIVFVLIVGTLAFSLRKVKGPIGELINNARLVADGKFDIKVTKQSFKEINLLTYAFQQMAGDLGRREFAAQELAQERQFKALLDVELETAGRIQENFLPDKQQLSRIPLPMDFYYSPATHVAGDWFDVCLTDDSIVVAIADVAGHGAGSSMFTAILAGGFKQAQVSTTGLVIDRFILEMNQVFLKIGKGKWHATVQVLEYFPSKRMLMVYNAGHPFPVMIGTDNSKRPKRIDLASTPIGITRDMTVESRQVKMEPGTTMFLYTDGLIEARNPEGKMFGAKKMVQMLQILDHSKPEILMASVKSQIADYCRGQPQDDDICIAAIKYL